MLLVFAGVDYYPSGGWDDYIGQAETVEAALAFAESPVAEAGANSYVPYTWVQTVDLETGEVHRFYDDGGEWAE